MVLQEFSIHETVSPSRFSSRLEAYQESVSRDLHELPPSIALTSRKPKTKKCECPFCHKRVKGTKALKQHLQAKHPHHKRKKEKNSRIIQNKAQFPATRKMSGCFCPTCSQHFTTKDGLFAHFEAQHQFSTVMVDENLASSVSQVQQLAKLFKVAVLPFPSEYHGKSDNKILDNLVKIHTGLVTRDKYFAKKAALFLSPVFLLWNGTIIKVN